MLAVTQLTGWGGAGQDDASIGGGVYMGMGTYLTRNAALSGSTLSKLGTFSCWFRRATWGQSETFFSLGQEWIWAYIWSDDVFGFSTSADGVTNEVNIGSTVVIPQDHLWHHIAFSYDLVAGACHLYQDGVNRLDLRAALNNANVDWRFTDFIIGSRWSEIDAPLVSCLAEFYLNTKEYLDLSLPANLAKFRTAAGKPAELGGDGSRPTGNRPLVYQRHVNKAAGSDIATNRGTGGGLTRSGPVPWEDSLSPSSPWNQVFGCVITGSGGGDFSGFTLRQRIPATKIFNNPSGQTQARLFFAVGEPATFTKCYIGNQGGGQPFDAADLTQVFFNGSPGATIPINGFLTSDPVNWTYNNGPVLVTTYYTSVADLIWGNSVGTQMYYKAGDDAATLNASGHTAAAADSSYMIAGIEMV